MPPPAVRPGSGLSFAWTEYTGRGAGFQQSYVFAQDVSQAALTIDCFWPAFASGEAIREILGHTALGRVQVPPVIRRQFLPWRHPRYSFFRAVKIASVIGVGPDGKEAGFQFAQYDLARITIIFQQLPYRVIGDNQLQTQFAGKEYHRFVSRKLEPTAEFITRERGVEVCPRSRRGGSGCDLRHAPVTCQAAN